MKSPTLKDGPNGRLWTVRDVASYLQVNKNTVYEWVAQRRLPCIRMGGRLRFDPADITRWVSARREG